MKHSNQSIRCDWPQEDPLMVAYHDDEWGVPLHDDQKLFEFLVLDTCQAGLSWKTILHKRENYRKAFDQFNANKIARYTERKIEKLMSDEGIIRNRQKIRAIVNNARSFLKIQRDCGTFDAYIWKFTNGAAKANAFKHAKNIPTKTRESQAMSKDLVGRDFSFVGPVICYAFMQAAGMVNDHVIQCFRYKKCN